MVCFSSKPIDPRQVYDLIGKDAAGSVLFHFAVAKAIDTKLGITTHITYEPNGDVEQGLKDIALEMREKWNLTDVLLLRRQGMVAVGEIISLVAVSSSSSEEAFAACRHGLARMKRMPTIIKTEIYL
jgi:molybdopterin synthase catalytic subunit